MLSEEELQRLQESLVEMARLDAPNARADGQLALAAHDVHKLAAREDRLQALLTAAVLLYADSMELFDAWVATRAKSRVEVEAQLVDKSEAENLQCLRRQIEMRTKGLGWTQFATCWSSCSNARIK